jgi:CubicO group peptidase (beta-lactamase class C family)
MTGLEAAVRRLAGQPFHPGVAVSVLGPGGEQHLAAGDLTVDTPCFFASATKLMGATVLHQLAGEGLDLDAPLASVVPVGGLLRQDGEDRTGAITIRQLMTHTSGLPDYLGSADPKRGLMGALLQGQDRGWSRAEALEMARRMAPVGQPGRMRRAQYSDTNYQLLDAVIEAVEGAPLADVLERRIIRPLGLRQTWLYADPADRRPAPLRYRKNRLEIPQAMASFRGDGGLVTTTREGLAFLRALWSGAFGPTDWLTRGPFRPVFFPVVYGEGVMRFALPRWMTPFRRFPALYGHSGHSGAALFHAPEVGVTIAATVNQIDRPGTVFKLILKAL